MAGVQGTVRDAAGPLAGVHVSAYLLDSTATRVSLPTAETHALGAFALMLPAGKPAELGFLHDGYRPRRTIVFAPCSGVDVVLERSPALHGRVVRRDGQPVSGAWVRWSSPHAALGTGATTTTATDGSFAFRDVPWSVDLEVVAADALPLHRLVQVTWAMTEVVVTVDAGRAASGTVLDAHSGAPIGGASIALWYYRSTYTAEGRRGGPAQHAETATTGVDGAFTLTRLPSAPERSRADAWLWVTARGRAPHAQRVPLAERADRVVVLLHAAGSVRGRVVDTAGAPVSGQRVFAESGAQLLCDAGDDPAFRRQDGGFSASWHTRRPEPAAPFHTEREAFTDAAGAYRIDGVPCPPGGGEVVIAVPDGTSKVTVIARPGEVAAAADIVRRDGILRRWHGVVQDGHARPIAGAAVEVGVSRTVTDGVGRFDFAVPAVPETREVRATAPGHVAFRGLAAEADDGSVTITLSRGAVLEVRVGDRDQQPVPDATVQVFPAGGLSDFGKGGPLPAPLCRGRTDDRGAVLLDGVPETCELLVELAGRDAVPHRVIVAPVAGAARTVQVVLPDLDLSAGTASLAVRVLDARTEAAYGGSVLVEVVAEHGATRRLLHEPEVRFEGLRRGMCEVRATAEGLASRSARVQLDSDQRLDLRLGAGIALSGQVACASGRPGHVQVRLRALPSGGVAFARTDDEGRFAFAGLEPGDHELSVEPFESSSFAPTSLRTPQAHVSAAPVRVRVAVGEQHPPVNLPVVPVRPLRVTVSADADGGAAASVWSWARAVHFTVTDERGRRVHEGGPTAITTTAAELELPVPDGIYTVRVQRLGTVLDERALASGESWSLRAR